jgi:type IV pilus assembly protein PilC/MSHA biogenesis protein MshG
MPTYTYIADTKEGEQMSGIIDANSPALAAALLRQQGMVPTKILTAAQQSSDVSLEAVRPAQVVRPELQRAPQRVAPDVRDHTTGPRPFTVTATPILDEVPLPELAAMYRQLTSLMHAGVPMLQSIEALRGQTRNGKLKSILGDAAMMISSGKPLSAAMEKYPNTFTLMQRELIRAGEMGGLLEVMCSRLAHYLEREIEIRRKLKRETLKPKITLAVAGLVILIVGWAGAGMGQAGAALVQSKLIFAGITAAIVFALWYFSRFINQFPRIGAFLDRILMLIPGPGRVAQSYATARFTRALGALYSGGVLLPTAVDIAARACGNRAIGLRMVESVPVLMQGGGLSAMLESTGLLSPIAVQMARTGEQTGSLDIMMDKVADYLESDADMKASQYAVYAGVGMLLLAAVVVGIIVIQFYSGYFTNLMGAGN